MRSPTSSLCANLALAAAAAICPPVSAEPPSRLEPTRPPLRLTFSVPADPDESAKGWARVLTAIGLVPAADGDIQLLPASEARDVSRNRSAPRAFSEWKALAESGRILIVEGDSQLAREFGFRPGTGRAAVRGVRDTHDPKVAVVWAAPVAVPLFDLPPGAEVFARDEESGAPLIAGLRHGAGAVLWTAIGPGGSGYERFPYLPQALRSLGLDPPFRSSRLWAFFDSSYRRRVDPDYFAARWRESGIQALHVAAWHFWEPDAARDQYLRDLIEACHKRAILVYAWLEFPHVSQQFWDDHPAWREKTAAGQDAHLDWRRLMNLLHPDCRREVAAGTARLIERFDWDGVNLAELYFESLEGAANPARFTPMSDTVRQAYRGAAGLDPRELFARPDHPGMQAFLDWRARLVEEMQRDWLGVMEGARRHRPWLDLVLTHVDDRYDSRMRDLIGSDASRVLPMLNERDFTFLVEDPAPLWHLGASRYTELGKRYRELAPRPEKLAIDLNIVERYQDVYPTKQQTGAELFELIHHAARAFPRVALYFEGSIRRADLPLLAAPAAGVHRVERAAGKLLVDSPHGAGVLWSGPALVDGQPWPVLDGVTVRLPPGPHTIEESANATPVRLLDLSAELSAAAIRDGSLEIAYRSTARVFAVIDREVAALEIDGAEVPLNTRRAPAGWLVMLPRGQHLVTFIPSSKKGAHP